MRIIDKTPFLEEDGSISFINRIQGTLQNGFSWYPNIQAQQKAIAIFERQLDKKFTLVRNHTLGASKITVPFILIGPPGVQIFLLTNEEGMYRAKADSWGTVDGEKYKEASINLLKRTAQLGRAVQMYLQKQNFALPVDVEPILLAINPKMHIDSVRPSVRIVMSDAVERFAASLRQSPPIMTVTDVHQLSEAILTPIRPKTAASVAPPVERAAAAPPPAPVDDYGSLGFSFNDEEEPESAFAEPAPLEPAPRPAAKKKPTRSASGGLFGMTNKQLIVLAAMAGFVALVLVAITIVALMTL